MFDLSYANILHSNVINFGIMISFFVLLFFVLKVPQKLESFRASIEKNVDESDSIREDAKKEFHSIEKSLVNLDKDLSSIINKAEEAAKAYEIKTREDLKKTVENIKRNVEKQVKNEEHHVSVSILDNISDASIEAAQIQISRALENDKSLHKKYILEAIDSLDELDV